MIELCKTLGVRLQKHLDVYVGERLTDKLLEKVEKSTTEFLRDSLHKDIMRYVEVKAVSKDSQLDIRFYVPEYGSSYRIAEALLDQSEKLTDHELNTLIAPLAYTLEKGF